MMFLPRKDGPSLTDIKTSPSFCEISRLSALRESLPVLRTGSFIPLWINSIGGSEDDGIFAFARGSEDGESFAVLVINASGEPRITGVTGAAMKLPASLNAAGKVLKPALTIGASKTVEPTPVAADGPLSLRVPASSLTVFEAIPAAE